MIILSIIILKKEAPVDRRSSLMVFVQHGTSDEWPLAAAARFRGPFSMRRCSPPLAFGARMRRALRAQQRAEAARPSRASARAAGRCGDCDDDGADGPKSLGI